MTKLFSLITILYLIFLGATSHAALNSGFDDGSVWKNQSTWFSPAQRPSDKLNTSLFPTYTNEDAYSDWVDRELDVGLIAKPEIPIEVLDCKQAVYMIRLFYAWTHKLPFTFTNKNGALVGNDSKMFARYSLGNARFYAFANYVRENATAPNLGEDTYPLSIDVTHIRPGAVFLDLAGAGINHSLTVWHSFKGIGFLDFIGGTTDPDLRSDIASKNLYESIMLRPDFTYTVKGKGGARYWRHREKFPTSKDEESEEGYSVEQFNDQPTNNQGQPGFLYYTDAQSATPVIHRWAEAVFYHLASNYEPADQIRYVFKPLVENVLNNRRIALLKVEEVKARMSPNSCMNAQDYENYTTANARDPDIIGVFNAIDDFLARQYQLGSRYYPQYVQAMNGWLSSNGINYLADNQTPDANHGAIFYQDFKEKLLSGQVSSNPNDSLDRKWGIINDNDPESTCPRYNFTPQ